MIITLVYKNKRIETETEDAPDTVYFYAEKKDPEIRDRIIKILDAPIIYKWFLTDPFDTIIL
jgi:hypothetical protein